MGMLRDNYGTSGLLYLIIGSRELVAFGATATAVFWLFWADGS